MIYINAVKLGKPQKNPPIRLGLEPAENISINLKKTYQSKSVRELQAKGRNLHIVYSLYADSVT